MMKLYSYWRSSAAYRVRIALNMKAINYEVIPVNLVAGEHVSPSHQKRNAMGSVPVLEIADGKMLSQSLAIIDYLDAHAPHPPLLPSADFERAKILEATFIIATDIHPVNNLRIIKKLGEDFGADDNAKKQWMIHFMVQGLKGFSVTINPSGEFTFGQMPTLADIALIPQLYNARRWGVDLSNFDRLTEIEANCLALEAFENARPEKQIDAQ